jgi:delta 1-pyrroline-5-carboxylate dehydrogenase
MHAFTLQTSQPTGQLLLHQRLHGQQHRRGSTRHALPASRSRKWFKTTAYRQHEATAVAQTPFEQQGPSVLLPIDFYGMLGVTRTAGAKSVRDALEKALVKRPEAYYSTDTVALRDLLLRNAADCLLNYEKRRGECQLPDISSAPASAEITV